MRVFYTASYYGKAKYQESYNRVLEAIKKTGAKIISPETGTYLSLLNKSDYSNIKSKKRLHYQAIRKGIKWADAVIIEVSHEDFQLGHEATLSIQLKKPTLCLSIHEDFSKKIKDPFFFGSKYNEYTVDEIVESFIKKAEREPLNQRFNLFLSKRQLSMLEEAAKAKNVNNSELVRILIDGLK